jgi:DNA-binding response OmpR family regulator
MSDVLLLIVEDEVLIASALEDALIDAGFACIVVHSGKVAIDRLNEEPARFRGVLTDIRLGRGPDGWEIGHRARELVPEMPIIYMSGDSAADWASKGVPNSLMLSKPYAFAQIITAISNMLNAVGTGTA